MAPKGWRVQVLDHEAAPADGDRVYFTIPVFDAGKARRVLLVAQVDWLSARAGGGGSFSAKILRIEDGENGRLWHSRIKALCQPQVSSAEVAA